MARADVVLFVIDARAGVTPQDRALRRSACAAPANPSSWSPTRRRPDGEAGAMEAYALGLGDPVAISAEHGEGLIDLYDALRG